MTAKDEGLTSPMRATLKISAHSLAEIIRDELDEAASQGEGFAGHDPDEELTVDEMIAEAIDNQLDMIRDDRDWGMLLDCPYLAMMAAGGNPPDSIHTLFYRQVRFLLYVLGDLDNE